LLPQGLLGNTARALNWQTGDGSRKMA